MNTDMRQVAQRLVGLVNRLMWFLPELLATAVSIAVAVVFSWPWALLAIAGVVVYTGSSYGTHVLRNYRNLRSRKSVTTESPESVTDVEEAA